MTLPPGCSPRLPQRCRLPVARCAKLQSAVAGSNCSFRVAVAASPRQPRSWEYPRKLVEVAMSADRVLLIDDEMEFVEVLAERLRARGLEVEVAFSGMDGVKKSQVTKF